MLDHFLSFPMFWLCWGNLWVFSLCLRLSTHLIFCHCWTQVPSLQGQTTRGKFKNWVEINYFHHNLITIFSDLSLSLLRGRNSWYIEEVGIYIHGFFLSKTESWYHHQNKGMTGRRVKTIEWSTFTLINLDKT